MPFDQVGVPVGVAELLGGVPGDFNFNVLLPRRKGDIGAALFAVTMLPAALIWGAGVRRGAARSLWRFLALSAFVAVATSVLAVPITMLYFGGAVDRGLEGVYS